MIEVRNIAPATPLTAVPASSKGAAEAQEQSGKQLPKIDEKSPVEEAPKEQPKTEVKLDVAVASITQYVQSIQRDLQFSVDADLEQTVIKVVDGDSGELIRQIPEEIFLELARKLNDDGELRLMDALG
ncbi:flagellar protein FlaG [Teredinibacter purpureus]|jgi:Uncharacterized flagellar protein FlaG|uniref:flagellar protein FlaG n=1 Tax=Teredinibacter purpureus TaxID=2731756 RepID=UPI0005F8325A|nr:flagellar protein FlaG [Teredinibacter purpureus]